MKIRIYPEHPNLPIGPAMGRVGSAMPLAIVGVPSGVTGVAVSVFNADGAACNLDATHRGCEWVATVPASHFASWGKIARGLQVAVSYKDETDATQTVVFVGDVRIEQTAAGDPEGTGRRSVPVTEVDEVEDGSSMKDIRSKVNELARIISGTVTALVLMALPLSAATPLEDIPGTNEVYTAAETDLAISNAIAQIPPPAPSMTTNDVCGIVTNTMKRFGEWVITPPAGEGERYSLYVFTNAENRLTGWLDIYVESMEQTISYDIDGDCPLDATEMSINFGSYQAKREASEHNALGLAREKDLPQNAPVDEIRFNGADGKVYRLRIGAGGSVDIYTEISQ